MHTPKRLLLAHVDSQWLYAAKDFSSAAVSSFAINGVRPGYSDTVDRIILPRPSDLPPGARSLDPDTLAELVAVTYATAQSPHLGVDAHGGIVLNSFLSVADVTQFNVDLIDPATLAILSTTGVPTSTFAPYTIGNPSPALLPTTGLVPRWVTAMGDGSAFKVMNGAAVVSTITAPDPVYPSALYCATDAAGRLITVWMDSSLAMSAHKIVVFDTDLSTVLCTYTPSYTAGATYTKQSRFKGSACFDPDGETFWYYSGVWHIDLFTVPANPEPRVFRFALDGSSANNAVVFDPWPSGSFPVDSGGHILVYGADLQVPTAGVMRPKGRSDRARFEHR